jgi:hypothetical protein
MTRHRIEIIGLDGSKFYSIGTVEVDSKQNYYAFLRLRDGVMKYSRHALGNYHNDLIARKTGKKTRWRTEKRVPISELKGIEEIFTFMLPIRNFEELFNEYKLPKTQGIFCIDLRENKEGTLNLTFQIVKREAFPEIINTTGKTEKKQAYIYAESNPVISLFAFFPKGTPHIAV